MCQQWEQRRNQKISWSKWKWEHKNPKSMGHKESNPRGKLIALQAILKKQEKAQKNI